MASFISEVLASAGKFKKEELHSKLNNLSARGDELKAHVHQFLLSRYADFSVALATTCHLHNQVKSLSEEVDQTTKRIENEMRVRLDASTSEFEELALELRRCEAIVSALGKLIAAHECVQQAESSIGMQSYSAASNALTRLQHIVADISDSKEGGAKIIQALHTECVVQRESLRHALAEQWKDVIVCSKPPKGSSEARAGQHASSQEPIRCYEAARLSISAAAAIQDGGAGLLQDVLQAMQSERMLDERLKELAGALMDSLLRVIISDGSAKLTMSKETSSQSHVLTLTTGPAAERRGNAGGPKPKQVLDKLKVVLGFVHEHLSSRCSAAASDGSSPSAPEPSLMRRLGLHIAVPLLEAVVDDCLALAIPRSHRDLDSFKAVADATAEFQAFLTSVDFLPPDGSINMLNDYVSNIHVLFANKKCQEILAHARELMKTDLLRMKKQNVDTFIKPGSPAPHDDDSDQLSGDHQRKHTILNRNTFRMPRCCISESASGLMEYVHEMLKEAADSSGYTDEAAAARCSAQIFCCVRGIFELYCAVSPVYHRRNIELLPQAAALFYNNSMYLAHEMLTLGHAYRHKWLSDLDADCSMAAPTFVDLVPKMRALGTDCFTQQLHRQKQLLRESLKGADCFKSLQESAGYASAERSIEQCTSLLAHLHHVWKDVLPINIYLKAIGGLLNAFLEELISFVVGLEDITVQAGKHIDCLFEKVGSGSLTLFVIEEDVSEQDIQSEDGAEQQQQHTETKRSAGSDSRAAAAGLLQRHVQRWQRFKELQRLLSASLYDVGERWADGKGPLAAEFSSTDVRQLVRALFQNTERRAAVLAKIK